MSTLAISAANLNVLEENLNTLANNVGSVYQSVNNVTGHVNEIDGKVTNVTENVKNLEEEIKSFMMEIRENSIVGNARQTILMDQNELNKKFGHYDEIRRRIGGILQSTDLNAIKKSTMQNIGEETLLNTPNYYLAPALVALCAWILDDKVLAENALKEAINRDDEKTSLLFCLINLRAHRWKSSLKWLNRYLNMQNPAKMDGKIVTVLNAITSGVFGPEAKEMCVNKVNEWLQELHSSAGYIDAQKERWINYLKHTIKECNDDNFPYLAHYTENWEILKQTISLSSTHNTIYKKIKKITDRENTTSNNTKAEIDNLLNMLVFSYDKEELDLRKDIQKNRHIIEENGNVKKAMERFEETSKIYDETNDLYNHLTNIVIEHKTIKPNVETRKYAMALEKNIIKDAYMEINAASKDALPDAIIKINEWKGTTKDGSNELELKASINHYVEKMYEEDLSKAKPFNIKMFISIITGLITMILSIKMPIITLLIFLVTLAYNIYEYYNAYKKREAIQKEINKNKKSANDILINIIAEIVDYSFIYKDNIAQRDKTINYINSLNPDEYIKSNSNTRNIIIKKEV